MHWRTGGALALGALLWPGCAHEASTAASNPAAERRFEELQHREPQLKAEVAGHPEDSDAHYDLGTLYEVTERPELALPEFEAVARSNPDDWHVVAKLIQVNQALGHLGERNRRHEQLLAMYRAGKVVNPSMEVFIRDQFRQGEFWVMVIQPFEFKGERPVRYAFELLPQAQRVGGTSQRRISLGSYEYDTRLARSDGSIGPNERLWHIDGYWPNGNHATYGIWKAEPSYDQTRAMVIQILAGEMKPWSTTTVH